MNEKLSAAIANAIAHGKSIGDRFITSEFDSGPNLDLCAVVSCPRTRKAGLVYYSESFGDVHHYLISFRKMKWMETEGWTTEEIVGKLGKEVFKRVRKHDFAYHLCMEGD